jgi:hypothetical protein
VDISLFPPPPPPPLSHVLALAGDRTPNDLLVSLAHILKQNSAQIVSFFLRRKMLPKLCQQHKTEINQKNIIQHHVIFSNNEFMSNLNMDRDNGFDTQLFQMARKHAIYNFASSLCVLEDTWSKATTCSVLQTPGTTKRRVHDRAERTTQTRAS